MNVPPLLPSDRNLSVRLRICSGHNANSSGDDPSPNRSGKRHAQGQVHDRRQFGVNLPSTMKYIINFNLLTAPRGRPRAHTRSLGRHQADVNGERTQADRSFQDGAV